MNLKKLIFTKNACYKAGKTMVPKGIMVHSTGVNNPYLKRYVGPDDGLLGRNQYDNHWNQDKPGGRLVCPHAFIGKLNDGSIATYQTLPWNHRGWHAGGSANNNYIGFEICEDGLTDATYFNAVYCEAVELCVYLCKKYGLTEKDIISHAEGYAKGIASNHGDPHRWWKYHNKTMDDFRAAVKAALFFKEEPEVTQDLFDKLMDNWLMRNNPTYNKVSDVPNYWKEEAADLIGAGAISGDGINELGLQHETLRAAIIGKRYTDMKR